MKDQPSQEDELLILLVGGALGHQYAGRVRAGFDIGQWKWYLVQRIRVSCTYIDESTKE